MTQQTSRKESDYITGSDLPKGDGNVGDEQVDAITDQGTGKPTGQDHSTDHHERQAPQSGVGKIQDKNLLRNDVADICD